MTRRPLRPEEVKLWTVVTKTVRPAPGAALPEIEAGTAQTAIKAKVRKPAAGPPPAKAAPAPAPKRRVREAEPDAIEPGRQRRITRERDPIDATIDLHGMGQFEAEDRLKAFLTRAQGQGLRAVLVITGKGTLGDGVIRRRAPEWLADPRLRDVVAGVSGAHRRHGGEGALYVALKRRPRL